MNINTSYKRSPLKFFLLVFILALPFWLLGFLVKTQGLPMDLPISALQFVCPLIAALILVYREEKSDSVKKLLQRIFDFKRIKQKIWYLPIFFLLPLIYALSYEVMLLMGRPLPAANIPWLTIPILFVAFFLGGICEELGWMGYSIDPMQDRWGALKASLILGSVWGIWHVIPWLQVHDTIWTAWQLFSAIATRLLIVWLYNNTGKSVFAAIIFHDMDNVSSSVFPINGSYYDPSITGPILAIVAVIVILLWGSKTLARFRYGRGAQAEMDQIDALSARSTEDSPTGTGDLSTL